MSDQRLRQLLQSAKDAGITPDVLVQRTAREGAPIGRSTLYELLGGSYKKERVPLPAAQLRALAEGIGVPWEVLRAAVLADLGYYEDGEIEFEASATAMMFDSVMANLTEDERRGVLAGMGTIIDTLVHPPAQVTPIRRTTAPKAKREAARRGEPENPPS